MLQLCGLCSLLSFIDARCSNHDRSPCSRCLPDVLACFYLVCLLGKARRDGVKRLGGRSYKMAYARLPLIEFASRLQDGAKFGEQPTLHTFCSPAFSGSPSGPTFPSQMYDLSSLLPFPLLRSRIIFCMFFNTPLLPLKTTCLKSRDSYRTTTRLNSRTIQLDRISILLSTRRCSTLITCTEHEIYNKKVCLPQATSTSPLRRRAGWVQTRVHLLNRVR